MVHSMHCYFLRPGRANDGLTFEVARLNDARSFSVRRVQVYQDTDVIMSMFASFQEVQEGLEHQERFDVSAIPPPEGLQSQSERYGDLAQDGRASWVFSRPFDLRYTTSDILLSVDDQSPQQMVWVRATSELDSRPILHRAALAFGSDYTLVETVLRAHGIPWATPGIRAASLDHAMWFHRPFRADEWLLYVHDSPTSQGGRGLIHGKFFNRAGELVASVSQEATVRATPPSS
jgi:acyl-CoA thioesterase-2